MGYHMQDKIKTKTKTNLLLRMIYQVYPLIKTEQVGDSVLAFSPLPRPPKPNNAAPSDGVAALSLSRTRCIQCWSSDEKHT